jgi:hypothetical protein
VIFIKGRSLLNVIKIIFDSGGGPWGHRLLVTIHSMIASFIHRAFERGFFLPVRGDFPFPEITPSLNRPLTHL